YNIKAYKMLAKYNPDFIWLDDDTRLIWHTPGYYGCFCPICMKAFSEKTGREINRETFAELTKGSSEEAMKLRKQWIEFNGETLTDLCKKIREATDDVNPNIELGQMSPDYNYSVNAYKGISDALSRNNTINTMWRPGGFYNKDFDKRNLNFKGIYIGKQMANYPDYITDIQSEVENDPDITLQKASYAVVLETCMHIGAGSTGIAYNVMAPGNDKIKFSMAPANETRYRDILKYRPFYEEMVNTFGRNRTNGVYLNNWNTDSILSLNTNNDKNWLDSEVRLMDFEMFETGIPMAFRQDNAPVTILYGENCYSMTDEEIMNMLSKGVYMDAVSLDILNRKGYGEFTGFELKEEFLYQHSKFLKHSINGDFEDYIRYNTKGDKDYILRKTDDNAEFLCCFTDIENDFADKPNMGIFENRLGGRICVEAYQFDRDIATYYKVFQLKNIMKYLSKNNIALVNSYANMIIYDRSEEKVGILLINNSYDMCENTEIIIPRDIEKVQVVDLNMNEKTVNRSKYEDNYSYFNMGDIPMFSPVLVKE
ncbi:MAG: hypothetical protein KBT47_08415, partial [Armatimonadetes bacterium]|nr:hypothetical protein [Candidatus Hippobium faecium]